MIIFTKNNKPLRLFLFVGAVLLHWPSQLPVFCSSTWRLMHSLFVLFLKYATLFNVFVAVPTVSLASVLWMWNSPASFSSLLSVPEISSLFPIVSVIFLLVPVFLKIFSLIVCSVHVIFSLRQLNHVSINSDLFFIREKIVLHSLTYRSLDIT